MHPPQGPLIAMCIVAGSLQICQPSTTGTKSTGMPLFQAVRKTGFPETKIP